KVCDFGHLGDGGQHYNLVWPKGTEPLSPEAMQRLRDGIYALVAEHGGSFSADHGLGPLLQRVYAAHTAPGVRQLSGQLQVLLNPGPGLGQFQFG
ncbi:MAG: FAD-linked oxidase C-terminal domain-containing protein, partial [Burkholderiales bacterium]